MKNKHPKKIWRVLFISLITGVVMTACTLSTENETQLVETLSVQGTWIANLSTQVAGQEEKNLSQWEAIGYLYTQMPYAQGVMTPGPPGQTEFPTPTPYILFTPTPYLDIEYPPGTRTGIDEIDTVIDAILDGDVSARLNLVHYTTTACEMKNDLGGPPNCTGEETSGSLVEVFPMYYQRELYYRPREIQGIFDFTVRGLLAVYTVPEEAFQADYWPAGEYGVVFTSEEGGEPHIIIVLVENGKIVRLEIEYTWPPFAAVRDRSDEFLLTPIR